MQHSIATLPLKNTKKQKAAPISSRVTSAAGVKTKIAEHFTTKTAIAIQTQYISIKEKYDMRSSKTGLGGEKYREAVRCGNTDYRRGCKAGFLRPGNTKTTLMIPAGSLQRDDRE